MNSLLKITLATCVAMLIGISCAAAAAFVSWNNPAQTVKKVDVTENQPVDGMLFFSNYVTEEYEYDDAYCLLYTDADANLFECEIIVDLKTYNMVRAYIANNEVICGVLKLNADASTMGFNVYMLVPDPETINTQIHANL